MFWSTCPRAAHMLVIPDLLCLLPAWIVGLMGAFVCLSPSPPAQHISPSRLASLAWPRTALWLVLLTRSIPACLPAQPTWFFWQILLAWLDPARLPAFPAWLLWPRLMFVLSHRLLPCLLWLLHQQYLHLVL